MNFLEGAQIAIDSLMLLKREVKITAYDTPPDSIGVVRMLTNPEFKEANMVIGTFPNSLVNAAVGAAKMANVNLLLTQAGTTSVLDNYANTALAFASTITQCRGMVSFMMAQYPDSKVILVYRTTKREEELAAIYKDEILKDKQSHEFVEHKSIEKGDKEIAALLSKTKRNVIFLISSDEAFISPVLSLFEEQNIFGVMVAGLPTWQNFESIDFMSMKNVQVMLFDNNFISYDAPERSVFRKAFISKYQNDPLNAAYNGFDIVFKMGIGFENREQKFQNWIRKSFPESTSDFNFIGDGFGGMENKFISVLKFNDYNLERINLK
ncbi:MAG: hypothetical protein IPP71_12800 [Bacteroidetes bacterium]|nr:hypothetical protein [Bacteroidota bacterium]